jgi:AcrR family transcriptional regulator
MASDARDRIIAGAGRLFARTGVRAAGVNAIIAEAGVAKATFYRHFQSKDAVVAAWLERRVEPRAEDMLAAIDAMAATPAERLGAFFDALTERLSSPDFVGFIFITAAMDQPEGVGPIRTYVESYMEQSRAVLRGLAAAAGAGDPDSTAESLQLITLGLLVRVRAEPRHREAAARQARHAAELLLDAAVRADASAPFLLHPPSPGP